MQPRESLGTHVWVRTDLVQAICRNAGSLPKQWRPRKRHRDEAVWGWCRATVSSAGTPRGEEITNHCSPFGPRLRRTSYDQSKYDSPERVSKTLAVTLTVTDAELAPHDLQHATVSFSYNTGDHSKVCSANTWWSEDQEPPEDLTSLEQLHEPAVVFCLKRRYDSDEIYTYTGKILLALNPFRSIDHLYGPDVMERYWRQHDSGIRPPPHIYAIAEDAYRSMVRSLQDSPNQSILVSGESGAGKTVTTKIIMRYLATLSQQRQNNKVGIESQVLQSNPILESFGNARTVRNDNSSRFGKFIEIRFDTAGCLVSASVETYLLEKVRLISQAPGERNYHVFYEMLAGLTRPERRQLQIGVATPRNFSMTAASGTFDRRDGVRDGDTFGELRHALDTVGFAPTDQMNLFQVAAALLHASNLTFLSANDEDASTLDRSNPSLAPAVALMGVDVEALNNALTRCAISARGEVLYKNLSIQKAQKAAQALIKTTYSALFQHIVRRVNGFITGGNSSLQGSASIGVLDIFGFESFDVNSYEQLLINYCNEALQQQFNRFVFKLEQQEYEREGIDWSFISFPDNQDVLDLIEKKHDGILSVLDEQSRLARCTDATFARAVCDKCRQHPRFHVTKHQQADLTFSVHHYAGLVEYDTANFLEKNKDELPKETTELLKSSSHVFVASLGHDLEDNAAAAATPRKSRRPIMQRQSSSILRDSVGSQFSAQLRLLRTRIEATCPHYVRCLKPNDDLVPCQYNALVIADQLRCAGVLEAIRVSRVGFPHRYAHDRFVRRYSLLARRARSCEHLVELLTTEIRAVDERNDPAVFLGMQMGRTKVFLRRRAFETLEYLRGKKLESAAAKIQSMGRMYICRINFEIAVYAAVVIQKFLRQIGAYRRVQSQRIDQAILSVQCAWRGAAARRILYAARGIAWWCQSTYRGIIARQLCAYLFLDKKISIIQRAWKHHRSGRAFRKLRRGVVTIQNRQRTKVARRELLRLRREARDLTSVAAERDKFRQESLRLQKELELAKKSPKIVYKTTTQKAAKTEEVSKLKAEVDRLQVQLEKAHRLNASPRNNEEDVRALMAELEHREEQLEFLRQELLTIRSHADSFSVSSVSRLSPLERISPLTHRRPSPARSDVSLLDDDALQGNLSVQEDVLSPLGISPFAPDTRRGVPPPIAPYPVSPKRPDKDELRYLHAAVRQGNKKLFDQLLNQTSELCVLINRGDQYGRTALHLAALAFNMEMAETLIAKGAVVNAQDNDGETPLHLAENFPMADLLLNEGKANPNIPNIDGICALHLAVQRRDSETVRALLVNNANVNNADNIRWFTALHLIALPPRAEVEADTSGDGSAHTAKLLTASHGQSKPDLNYQDREGNSPLHYAVQLDTEEACRLVNVFLERGANPNICNERNQSPLHLLCHNEELRNSDVFHEMLHAFLYNGADPNVQSLTGCTPLHLSLYHKDIESAIQLVRGGAELHYLWKKVRRHHFEATHLAVTTISYQYPSFLMFLLDAVALALGLFLAGHWFVRNPCS